MDLCIPCVNQRENDVCNITYTLSSSSLKAKTILCNHFLLKIYITFVLYNDFYLLLIVQT